MSYNKKAAEYLVSLINSTLHDETPMEKPEGVDWIELFQMANFQQVEELVYYSMQKLANKPAGEAQEMWNNAHGRNMTIDLLQKEEAKYIENEVTKNKIGLLPLKGAVIKTLYPQSVLRYAGDLDFLVEPGKVDEVEPIMKELAYDDLSVGLEDSHDVYEKKPYLEVEMHRRLLSPTEENHWYIDDIWQRLVSDENNPYLMHMTWTDLYMFHLLHFEKHHSLSGSGIRYIVDHYILKTKLKDKIDWDYVNELLPKMNYVEFEKMCGSLADAWFGEGEMTDELREQADFLFDNGAFGTYDTLKATLKERYKQDYNIKTEKGFFLRRMFMERERMEFSYPSLKKHGWLLPFCWIHRLFKAVLFKRGRVKTELDSFKKDKEKE